MFIFTIQVMFCLLNFYKMTFNLRSKLFLLPLSLIQTDKLLKHSTNDTSIRKDLTNLPASMLSNGSTTELRNGTRQVTFGGEQICSETSMPISNSAATKMQSLTGQQTHSKCETCGRANNSQATTTNLSNSNNSNTAEANGKPDTNPLEDNEIVDKAKVMGQMLTELIQFTQGASELKTTQDYFTLGESLGEEANKFYKLVRQFTYQVISSLLLFSSSSFCFLFCC